MLLNLKTEMNLILQRNLKQVLNIEALYFNIANV